MTEPPENPDETEEAELPQAAADSSPITEGMFANMGMWIIVIAYVAVASVFMIVITIVLVKKSKKLKSTVTKT